MMHRKEALRVLLLDDTKEVLEHLKANVERFVNVGKLRTRIEVTTVHIQMENIAGGNGYQIKSETVIDLAEACSQRFDYVILDFAFIGDRTENDKLRAQLLAQNRDVTKSDLSTGTILECKDIKARFEVMRDRSLTNRQLIRNFESNFLGHKNKVVVYTHSPDPYANYFKPPVYSIRVNEILEVFQHATDVRFLLMHDEFPIPRSTPQDTTLEPFLSTMLSNRLDNELHILALMRMVESQHKLRFKNTRWAFNKITAIGVGIGVGIAVFGEVIYHLIENVVAIVRQPDWTYSELLLYLSPIVVLLFLSFGLISYLGVWFARVTERWVADLLGHEDNT